MEEDLRLNSTEQQYPLDVLILAAGLGTRMKSKQAKVLHELGGRPMIAYVVRQALSLSPGMIYVVVGHQAAEVEAAVRKELGEKADQAEFAVQAEQRGTGDAVKAARARLRQTDRTLLVLSGDVPLVRAETLKKLIEQHLVNHAACSIPHGEARESDRLWSHGV